MDLAYSAGRYGGTMPAVLNAANEEAVAQFLDEKIHFLQIPELIEKACDKHKNDLNQEPTLEEILAVDQWARRNVKDQILYLNKI